MESSEIVVGLDIGTTKIAVVVVRKFRHGKIEILGHRKTSFVRSGEENLETDGIALKIKELVDDLSAELGMEIKSVNWTRSPRAWTRPSPSRSSPRSRRAPPAPG